MPQSRSTAHPRHQKKESWGRHNNKTNATYERKKNCNRGTALKLNTSFVVYSTRRFVVSLSVCHFVLVFFGPFSIAIISLGKERANLSAFRTFVRFVLVWICRFPFPLGVWEGLRFVIVAPPLDFSVTFFFTTRALKPVLLARNRARNSDVAPNYKSFSLRTYPYIYNYIIVSFWQKNVHKHWCRKPVQKSVVKKTDHPDMTWIVLPEQLNSKLTKLYLFLLYFCNTGTAVPGILLFTTKLLSVRLLSLNPVSILYKSIAGRYRPVSYPDGPITARYRFI